MPSFLFFSPPGSFPEIFCGTGEIEENRVGQEHQSCRVNEFFCLLISSLARLQFELLQVLLSPLQNCVLEYKYTFPLSNSLMSFKKHCFSRATKRSYAQSNYFLLKKQSEVNCWESNKLLIAPPKRNSITRQKLLASLKGASYLDYRKEIEFQVL